MESMPLIAFLVSGIISAYAQRAFFQAVAEHKRSVRTDLQMADEIRHDPIHLPGLVGAEMQRRFRALVSRQDDPATERLRWIAGGTFILILLSFGWLLVSPSM